MFTVTIHKQPERKYLSATLISNDDSHFINIHISEDHGIINASVSKSDDGFHFKSPCREAADLNINSAEGLDETFDQIKRHFLDKGYRFYSS